MSSQGRVAATPTADPTSATTLTAASRATSTGTSTATFTAALITPLTAALTAVLTAVWLVLSVAGAGPAAAHAQLVSSNPADEAVLTAMPEHVEFVFNEDINPSFAQVVVGDGARDQAVDDVTVDGPAVRAAIPSDVTQAEVTARYRVVSADGHPISGEITCTVAQGTSTTPASAGAAEGENSPTAPNATASNTAPSTVPTTAVPNADETADIEAASSSADAPNVVPYMLMGLAALLMVAFGAYLLRSERRRR